MLVVEAADRCTIVVKHRVEDLQPETTANSINSARVSTSRLSRQIALRVEIDSV